MNYEQLYQRNLGIFTKEEQAKLKNAHVFVAGVGGVGGIQAVTLARMGIGELTIMDPGIFDEPDFNRQYAATINNLGKNKAVATGEMLREIAPFAKTNVITTKIDEASLRMHIKKTTSIVIDGIDMWDFAYKRLFAKVAKEEGKYSITSPIPDLGTVLMTFDPNGMSFEEFTKGKDHYPRSIVSYAQHGTFASSEKTEPFLASTASNSGAATLSGALLAIEVALIITGKKSLKQIVTVPNVTYVDFFYGFFKTFNPLELTLQ
jgi:molybdopterin/thiamine biosynthesis adenylyltransferase